MSIHKSRIGIGVLFLLCGLNFATWATRIPDFKQLLHLSDATLGTVLMGLPIGSLVSLPLAGWLIAKYNSKIICLIAVCMYVVVIPLIGFSTSALALFGGLFLFGMSGDILNIAMNTQVISLEKKMSKIIMSSFHAIFSVGLMLGALLGGLVVTFHIGFISHFYGIALLNLLLIPSFYFFLLPDESPAEKNEETKSSIFHLGTYLIILACIAFCGMLCEGAMADWISLYFAETIKSSSLPNTIGFTSFAAAMVIGRLAGDYLSNKFQVKQILVINGILVAVGMVITLVFPQLAIKVVGCFIIGIGISTIVPLIYSKAGTQTKIAPSIAIAGVSTIAYIGFLLGPVLIGYLADLISLQYALVLLIILGLVASAIATVFLPNSEK
jgi:predicted MFS family arabinose efflux permease